MRTGKIEVAFHTGHAALLAAGVWSLGTGGTFGLYLGAYLIICRLVLTLLKAFHLLLTGGR